MTTLSRVVGSPVDRVEGRAKVTGEARYAAEFQVKDVAYGVLVLSTVARGRVTKIDTAAAEKAPGVLAVITHRNAGKVVLPESKTESFCKGKYAGDDSAALETFDPTLPPSGDWDVGTLASSTICSSRRSMRI